MGEGGGVASGSAGSGSLEDALAAELWGAEDDAEGDAASPGVVPAPAPDACLHPVQLEGICTHCGALVGGAGQSAVLLGHVTPGLAATIEGAGLLRAMGAASAVREGRLHLVLDLDHTLLNSTGDSRLALRVHERVGLMRMLKSEQESSGDGPEGRSLFWFPSTQSEGMWTKLRPGVRRFLREASQRFSVSINTLGSRQYASAMARLLDPDSRTFRRVLGKEDGVDASKKTLASNLDLDERTTLVLDDSPDRWGACASIVVPIHRYHYFPSSTRDFGQSESLCHLLRGDDEAEEGGPLSHALRLLVAVHDEFFRQTKAGGLPTTKGVLRHCRRGVLEGEEICFTRIISLRMRDTPDRHPEWRLALSLGARCSLDLTPTTTVVVAGSRGTEKVLAAEARGLPCVGIEWLRACAAGVAKADPVLYPPPEPTDVRMR